MLHCDSGPSSGYAPPPHLPALLIAALGLVQLLALPGEYLGKEHDDAHYVLAAGSLIRGDYRLGVSPGDPPLTFITPGWPLLLTPAALLSGDNPIGYHLTAWLCLVACDALLLAWLRRRLPWGGAALCTVLFALNPLVLARAGKVMTEVPALALTLALFLALEREAWPSWGTGLLLGFAWLVRQPCIALLPPACLWYARRGRWPDALICGAIPLAVMGAWSRLLSGVGAALPEIGELSAAYASGWKEPAWAVKENAAYYASLLGCVSLPRAPAWGPVETAVGACLLALSAVQCWKLLRAGGYDPAVAWMFFGSLMHAFWPWHYERYLLPFLPMGIYTLYRGFQDAVPSGKRVWINVVLGAAIGLQWLGQGRHLTDVRAGRSTVEFQQTYAWIREHVHPGRAMASLFYSRDAFYTGRPFGPIPKGGGSGQELAPALARRGFCCVLMTDLVDAGFSRPGPLSRELAALREELQRPPFGVLYRNSREGATLYALVPKVAEGKP